PNFFRRVHWHSFAPGLECDRPVSPARSLNWLRRHYLANMCRIYRPIPAATESSEAGGVCNSTPSGTLAAQLGLMRRAVRLLRDTTGANLLEAAIITPLLLLLSFGICDLSSVFYAYLALENGISIATRFAVTGNQMNDPNNPAQVLSRVDSIKTAMRQATPTLTIPDSAFTFEHMSPGGAGWVAGVGGPNDIEKVTVNYTWDIMTPLIRPFFAGGQVQMQVASSMKNEGRFQ